MSNQKPDFTALEKETLKELSLETLKTTLVSSFKKLHQEQLETFEQKLGALEKGCRLEVQRAVEKHVRKELEANFHTVLTSSQNQIRLLVSPLLKNAEQDVKRLEAAVNRTNTLCENIQKQYSFRWSRPFLILILSTSLTGAFLGLMLLFKTSPLAFLMDSRFREAYEYGMKHIEAKEKWDALPQAEKDAFLGRTGKADVSPASTPAPKKGSSSTQATPKASPRREKVTKKKRSR